MPKFLAAKLEGKKLLGRPKRRWYGNIKWDLRHTVYWGVDWMYLVEDMDWKQAFVSMVMYLLVP
jgi:hypothetical protein